MTEQTHIVVENGDVIDVPLNKLRKSPRNARKTPHPPEAIEERAASIQAKGVIQPLVVEPETDAEGGTTGFYLVTVGEGRRLALLLLAQRKAVKKTCPVRCVVEERTQTREVTDDERRAIYGGRK